MLVQTSVGINAAYPTSSKQQEELHEDTEDSQPYLCPKDWRTRKHKQNLESIYDVGSFNLKARIICVKDSESMRCDFSRI